MKPYKVLVRYVRNGSSEKQMELECHELPVAGIVDSFVLEQVMRNEEPDLLSIYPLLKDIPRGAPAQRMPTNVELMKMHGISKLSYEIDERIFCIST